MSPYGRRTPIRRTVAGHQDCALCLPDDVSKRRARREAARECAVTEERTDAVEPK